MQDITRCQVITLPSKMADDFSLQSRDFIKDYYLQFTISQDKEQNSLFFKLLGTHGSIRLTNTNKLSNIRLVHQ